MKKYLISIENIESPRLSNFFAQNTFQHKSEDFKVFGVIGKQLDVCDYFKLGVLGKVKALTPGELGCTLSHLAALKDFLASGDDYAVIFEDDAIERFYVDFEQIEQEISGMNLTNCFFLSLGGIQLRICDRVRGQYLDCSLLGQSILQIDPDFLENLSYAYAYVVDRAMAELLLQYHHSPRVYDHWKALADLGTSFTFYATYIFDHPIIEQEKHLSYLEEERRDNNIVCCDRPSYIRYWRKKLKKLFLKTYPIIK